MGTPAQPGGGPGPTHPPACLPAAPRLFTVERNCAEPRRERMLGVANVDEGLLVLAGCWETGPTAASKATAGHPPPLSLSPGAGQPRAGDTGTSFLMLACPLAACLPGLGALTD